MRSILTDVLPENRDIHQNIPDHRVKLTPEGWTQAHEAGRRLRALLQPHDTLHFFTSPYRRTRETTEGILSTLTSDDPSPSPFPRRNIKVYEEPRLREQDFGNFQPCSAEMERMWQERADYGHFFYRIPNGESAADAYDRVSGFNESLWRQFGEDDCASVCVLVTHGLMSRVFLMKWYHFSVEYFEDLRNVNHCEFLIMRKREDSGKYILETKLRTWSELKCERAAALKEKLEKERKEGNVSKEPGSLPALSTEVGTGPKPGDLSPNCPAIPQVPKRKQWGGCPNGCDHGRFHYRKENSMRSMTTNGAVSNSPLEAPPIRRPFKPRFLSSSEEDEDDPRGRLSDPTKDQSSRSPSGSRSGTDNGNGHSAIPDINRGIDSLMLSSSADPHASKAGRSRSKSHSKSKESLVHVGRDFGGSASGHTSLANSDTETDADAEAERKRRREKALFRQKMRGKREREWTANSGMGRGAKADALGDQSGSEAESVECTHEHHKVHGPEHGEEHHHLHEQGHEGETEEEKHEKSVEGSVR